MKRKMTPKVRDGRVQRKNRTDFSSSVWDSDPSSRFIDVERPGRGFRHVLRRQHVVRFLELLPSPEGVLTGLNGILLARGDRELDGWYQHRVIGICAWPRELTLELWDPYLEKHRETFERLGVPLVPAEGGWARCDFTEHTARAFQLLHVFMHELGHHYDRETTRSKRRSSRGEDFAEDYALVHEEEIWDKYCREFSI